MQPNKYQLLSEGLYIQTITPEYRLLSLIEKLRPVRADLDLIRIGSDSDGGYLVPNDLNGISACFSPGVGPTSSFEEDLFTRFSIPSHLCDYSVSGPPGNFKPASFEKKFLGATEDDRFTTLNNWMEKSPEYDLETDLILQMDIEGGEYTAILSTEEDKLKRFRIIIVEFHNAEHWSDPAFFEIADSTFSKLLKHFYVLHIHPNNYGNLLRLGQVIVPDVFELSLVRKDRCTPIGNPETLPHALDRPCNPNNPEIILPEYWYKQSTSRFSSNQFVFDEIYRGRQWGGTPERMSSGPGSHQQHIVAPYVSIVLDLMRELNCKEIIDLGCGDLNIGQHLLNGCESFLACDISEVILQQNREIFSNPKLKFCHIDITKGALPKGDIALVRQVLQHLSNAEINLFIAHLLREKPYRYMLVTEHIPNEDDFIANIDMPTGKGVRVSFGSGVELDKPPFNLNYKSKNIILEIQEPVNDVPAVLRSTLFELF